MSFQGGVAPRAAAIWLTALVGLVGCSAAPASTVVPLTAIPLAPTVVASIGGPAPAGTTAAPIPTPVTSATPVVAVPTPSASPSVPTTDPDPATPAGMSKQVLGFFLPGQMDYVLAHTDFSVLTTIAYFGISTNAKGALHKKDHGTVFDWRWNAWIGSKMTRIINKAHAAGTKVVLTVTRFAWTSGSYNASVRMLSAAANRAKLAKQTADAVVDRGVDGVNVDFEPIPASQKANFVDFVRRLRTELDARRHGLQLTVDSTGYIANYDVAGLTAPGAADAIFIMAYHYTGTWSKHAAAVSPLRRNSYDVTDTVKAFLHYTTPDKIMLGLPYYGNTWATTTGNLMSETRPGSSTYGHPGSVIYSHAVGIAAAHGKLWDNVESVPWTRWQARACNSCPLSWHQLYYEDAHSLRLKHELVIDNNLRGTGIWTLGFGGNGPELNDELRSSFGSH